MTPCSAAWMRRAGEKAARLLASGQPSAHCRVHVPSSTRKAKKAPPATEVAVAETANETALKARASRRSARKPLSCLVVSILDDALLGGLDAPGRGEGGQALGQRPAVGPLQGPRPEQHQEGEEGSAGHGGGGRRDGQRDGVEGQGQQEERQEAAELLGGLDLR